MQHVLQISRKIDYALLAMIHLAGLPDGRIASLRDYWNIADYLVQVGILTPPS